MPPASVDEHVTAPVSVPAYSSEAAPHAWQAHTPPAPTSSAGLSSVADAVKCSYVCFTAQTCSFAPASAQSDDAERGSNDRSAHGTASGRVTSSLRVDHCVQPRARGRARRPPPPRGCRRGRRRAEHLLRFPAAVSDASRLIEPMPQTWTVASTSRSAKATSFAFGHTAQAGNPGGGVPHAAECARRSHTEAELERRPAAAPRHARSSRCR